METAHMPMIVDVIFFHTSCVPKWWVTLYENTGTAEKMDNMSVALGASAH
jgi:hypothetical protein